MKHDGNLAITKENANDFCALTSVSGDIYVDAETAFPNLTWVKGDIYIRADVQLPMLKNVSGGMHVRANTNFQSLEFVGGWLDICAESQFQALQVVGKSLSIYAKSKIPYLMYVGWRLGVYADAELPRLVSVGGALYVSLCANAQLPYLVRAHGVAGKLIAVKKYGLWKSSDGFYYAGCKGPMTKEQARELAETWHEKEIAEFFINAIIEEEKNGSQTNRCCT